MKNMKIGKKFLKIISLIFIIILFLIIFLIIILLIIRAIKSNKLYNEYQINSTNGIDKEETIELGGIKQYIYIRGEEKSNPIILVLHGGPGTPMTPVSYLYQTTLEKDYTIVNWDQRNAGKTFFLNDPKKIYETLSINTTVNDLKELILYLREKFHQEKIIIMGHSWGSVIGSIFVKTYPEYVSAYIGTGQVINASEGDQLAFNKALELARMANNSKDVKLMENLKGYLISDPNFSLKAFMEERKMVAKYLVNGYNDSHIDEYFFSPYHTLKEFTFYLKTAYNLQKPLIEEMGKSYDIRDYGNNYNVPILYIMGDHDWSTPVSLAKSYYDLIEAPYKSFVIVENAGHSAMFDQPENFTNALLTFLVTLNA